MHSYLLLCSHFGGQLIPFRYGIKMYDETLVINLYSLSITFEFRELSQMNIIILFAIRAVYRTNIRRESRMINIAVKCTAYSASNIQYQIHCTFGLICAVHLVLLLDTLTERDLYCMRPVMTKGVQLGTNDFNDSYLLIKFCTIV